MAHPAQWTASDVEHLMIAATKLDRLAPRVKMPKPPGNSYMTTVDTREEIAAIEEIMAKERVEKDYSRDPLLRAEVAFMDAALGWFSYLADESEATRNTFRAWLLGKAGGHGAMKRFAPGIPNGSLAHARQRCVDAIVRGLNADRVAKIRNPNPGRWQKARPARRKAA